MRMIIIINVVQFIRIEITIHPTNGYPVYELQRGRGKAPHRVEEIKQNIFRL